MEQGIRWLCDRFCRQFFTPNQSRSDWRAAASPREGPHFAPAFASARAGASQAAPRIGMYAQTSPQPSGRVCDVEEQPSAEGRLRAADPDGPTLTANISTKTAAAARRSLQPSPYKTKNRPSRKAAEQMIDKSVIGQCRLQRSSKYEPDLLKKMSHFA